MEFKGTKGKWSINHWSNKQKGITDRINYYQGDNINENKFGIRSRVNNHNVTGSFECAHIADIVDFSDESKANALLISKAPEMLDELKNTLKVLKYITILTSHKPTIARIEKLIKEATTI